MLTSLQLEGRFAWSAPGGHGRSTRRNVEAGRWVCMPSCVNCDSPERLDKKCDGGVHQPDSVAEKEQARLVCPACSVSLHCRCLSIPARARPRARGSHRSLPRALRSFVTGPPASPDQGQLPRWKPWSVQLISNCREVRAWADVKQPLITSAKMTC